VPDAQPRRVAVELDRLAAFIARFEARHEGTSWVVTADAVRGAAPDGAFVALAVPFAPLGSTPRSSGAAPQPPDAGGWTMTDVIAHVGQRWQLGLLLVRKGGFAVAHVRGAEIAESKVGRRHVQGRSKAGGWSQQRFARRRDQQARGAYAAAADHASAILPPVAAQLDRLALGGDAKALETVLGDQRLRALTDVPRLTLTDIGEPRRDTLEAAVRQVRSAIVDVHDPTRR
jgi:hypothetical protein